MMNRWLWALACVVSGLLLLVCGVLVPAHVRGVDVSVTQLAGRNTPTLVEQGLALVNETRLGTAQLFLQAAQAEGIPGREALGLAVTNAVQPHPDWLVWGNNTSLAHLFGDDASLPEPFTEFIIREKNRDAALELLRSLPNPTVQELLRCRELTHTVLFTPSQSSSGQAFDAALTICGLLLAEGQLT